MSPLCFNDVAILRRKNEITEDEYVQAIVDHCTGLRHGSNGACNNDTTEPGARGVGLGYNVKDDAFAAAMASWIYKHFDGTPVEDTTPVYETLQAYGCNDIERFKSSIRDVDKACGRQAGTGNSSSLSSRLATDAIANENADILEAILEVHGRGPIEFPFHHYFDTLKHEGDNPMIVQIVEDSGFKSMVPEGKRFSDLHPLDFLM